MKQNRMHVYFLMVLFIAGTSAANTISIKAQYIDLNEYPDIAYNRSGDGFIAFEDRFDYDPTMDEGSGATNAVVYSLDSNGMWGKLGNTVEGPAPIIEYDEAQPDGFYTNIPEVVAAVISDDKQTIVVNYIQDSYDSQGTGSSETNLYGSYIYNLVSNEWTSVFATTSTVEQLSVSGDGSIFIEKQKLENNIHFHCYRKLSSSTAHLYERFQTLILPYDEMSYSSDDPYINRISMDGSRVFFTDEIATNYCKVMELDGYHQFQEIENYTLDGNTRNVWADEDVNRIVSVSDTNILINIVGDSAETNIHVFGIEPKPGMVFDGSIAQSLSLIGFDPIRFIHWTRAPISIGVPEEEIISFLGGDELSLMVREIERVSDIERGSYDMYSSSAVEFLYGGTAHGYWDQGGNNDDASGSNDLSYIFYTVVEEDNSSVDVDELMITVNQLEQTILALSNQLEVTSATLQTNMAADIILQSDVLMNRDNIDAEEAARIAADTAETNARIAADDNLQDNIDTEEAARIAADLAITADISSINGRLSNLEQLHTLLISALNMEISMRENAIASLESELNTLSNSVQNLSVSSNQYTLAEAQALMRDLRVGSSMINVSNGVARLSLSVDESDDLTESWSSTEHNLEVNIPASNETMFYRFRFD